ncbi:MAG: TPM domain-containing protein [Janthinobacterium lividum]|jgi:uncharacterized membrane protein
MTHPLTPAQEEALVAAIQQAELRTSGEIRLHIEEKCPTPEPLDRAAQVFAELKMHQTKLRNGVLFYMAWQSRQFAVVGDAGINSAVPDEFWESVKETVVSHFRQEHYVTGLERGIRLVGEQLLHFFPYDAATDINELDDNISYGDDAQPGPTPSSPPRK